MSHLHSGSSFISQSVQSELDGKVALVSATKQTIGSALDVSGNINLPTGSQYQINGVSITAGGGSGGTPGGVEGSVQYNASGAFAGESDFNYSASTNTLTLTNGTLRPSVINFNTDNIAITGNNTITNQSTGAIAVGYQAGQSYQGNSAVAIGYQAGQTRQGQSLASLPAGTLDTSFGTNGIVITDLSGYADSVKIDSLNRIVVAGYTTVGDTTDFAVVRYNPSGNLDTSFGNNGIVITNLNGNNNDYAYSLAIDSLERILVAGYTTAGGNNFAVVRYDSAGNLDTTFGPNNNGIVITDLNGNNNDFATSVAIDSLERIVVAGYTTAGGSNNFAAVRYDPSGNLDTSFGNNGIVITDINGNNTDYAYSVAIDSLNRIVFVGFTAAGGSNNFAVVRYDPSGNLDTTFGNSGIVITDIGGNNNDYAVLVAIDSSDKVVVAGFTEAVSNDFAVVRYDSAGNLDTTFGPNNNGKVITDLNGNSVDHAYSVAIDSLNRIVVVGFTTAGSNYDFAVVRYDPSGNLDTTFGNNGIVITDLHGTNNNDQGLGLTIDSSDRVVVAGINNNNFAVVRYYGLATNADIYNFNDAIAIGYRAGQSNQGEHSVAIGYHAGLINQHNNSIILNATGTSLNSTTTDALFIAPIRTETDLTGLNSVYYNTTTKEMMTGVQSGGSSVAETLTNKTISGSSNTITNLPISSSTGLQTVLDGKVALVSATKQTIGSALDVSGTINIPTGSEFQINGVPIGGGGSNLPTIDTLMVDGSIENFSQTDITYIIGCVISAHIALNNFYDFPAGKTKTIIAEELNGKIVLILTDGGIALSPGLSKNGQQQTFLWDGTKWTYDDNKITTRLVGWGTTPLTPPNSNTTIQSELQESGDINLLTGKKYKINSVNLEAVAETLSNKTISGSSNTILNLPISSSTGLQTALDGKVALVSATKQTIGSALDVSGTINIPTGSEFQINGVPIGGGGSNLPTIDTLVITGSGLLLSQTDITYIIGYTHNFYGATIELNSENLPAGKTKTIIATELNGKIVIILDRLGNPISPNLTKNGQQQTFQWNGIDWTYDDNKITTNLLGWGGELGLPSNNNTTIQSELQQSGDINLLTGKKYKINSVNLEAVAETLSNKTISGTSNTILNLPISSTTGLQTALNSCVIKPIRNETNLSGFLQLYYNPTTGELVYN